MVLMTCLQLLMVLQWKYTWQGSTGVGRKGIKKVMDG